MESDKIPYKEQITFEEIESRAPPKTQIIQD